MCLFQAADETARDVVVPRTTLFDIFQRHGLPDLTDSIDASATPDDLPVGDV